MKRSLPTGLSFRRGAAALCLSAAAWLALPAASAPATPGWEALPAETIACFRMPNTQAFLKTFRGQTAMGQRVLTQERFDQALELIKEQAGGDWDQFVEELEEYGFTFDDLLEIAQNNWGAALVADPRGDELPRFMLLAWADLEDADIDRIYAAIDKANQDNPDQDTRRVDLELAGVSVRQYSTAETGLDNEEDWENAKTIKIDETHGLLARVPGRMMLALGFPQSADKVRQLLAQGQAIDWDEATEVESVQGVFARFLEAQNGGGDKAFATNMLAQPEAAAAVEGGLPLMEFYADTGRILSLIGAGIELDSGAENAQQYREVIRSLGLDTLGVLAGSVRYGDNAVRSDLFLQMPNRTALPATLDGQELPAAPPAWVPAGVTYFHLAYDLGKLYDVVIQTVQDIGGPDAMQNVQLANHQVQAIVQADIRSILSALGTRHAIMLLEGRQVTFQEEEYDFDTQATKTVQKTQFMRPGAFVWDLADAGVVNRLVVAAKNFIPLAGPDSGLAPAEEQGFTGIRLSKGSVPGGLMLGRGKLVVSFGPEVTEQTLSLINNPPAGDKALANSPLFGEGQQIMQHRDGVMYFIQDGGQDLVNTKKQVLAEMDNPDAGLDPELAQRITALFPSDDDLRASMGVSVGQSYLTGNGLILQNVIATPAAE